MTKGEINTIRNLIERLKKPNCGSGHSFEIDKLMIAALNAQQYEVVGRLYLDTWVIPSLEMLLPESRNVELAESMCR